MRIKHVFGIILCMALFGCTHGMSGDDLLTLPRQPLELQALSQEIDKLIDQNNATLIAPIAGANRQTIQKRDLTGDGIDNVIIFFQDAGDEPIHIAIFSQSDGEFELLCFHVSPRDGNALPHYINHYTT